MISSAPGKLSFGKKADKSITIQKIYNKFQRQLLPVGDFLILASHASGISKEKIISNPEINLSNQKQALLLSYIKRRIQKEPIAYIVNCKEFYGYKFFVNKKVLIPRPETELLVDESLSISKSLFKKNEKNIFIDLGTGSGAIAIAFFKKIKKSVRKKIKFFALDSNEDSLKIAKRNAKSNKARGIIFIQSYFFKKFPKKYLSHANVLITANLPYVSRKNFLKNKNNLCYEPRSAIESPLHGLYHNFAFLKEFASINSQFPSSNIAFILEFSPEQKKLLNAKINALFKKKSIKLIKDYSGKWRFLSVKI